MERKIGYAVVGLGVGMAHVRGVLESERGKLVAVCDLLEEKLKRVRDEHPEVLTYTDFDEMLKNPDIEIISIALPSGMHGEFAIKAMEAGKNVLIEKPMEITVEAANKIIEAWKRTGVKVGVVHQNRNNANMAPMKEAIDSGRIGDLYLGTFEVKWYRDQPYYDHGGWRGTWEMDGGGSLMNQAVHTIDLMQWLMGDVESVTSTMKICAHDIKTEDMTASLVKFKNGATATFVSTTNAFPGLNTGIKIYGTKGSIEADGDRMLLWKIMGMAEGEEKEMLNRYQGNSAAAALDPKLAVGHPSVVADMIDAVYYDRDPMIIPTEGVKAVKIVNAIYESARTNKTVYID